VYDSLSEWVTPTLDEMVVNMPETITVTLNGIPNTSSYTEEDAAAFSAAVFGACKPGVDSLLFDMPEIFWLNPAGLSIGVEKVTYTYSNRTKKYTFKISSLKFTPALEPEIGTLDKAMEYKEKLETAVEEFAPTEGTMYDKIKTIHDSIAKFTYYDESAGLMSSAIGSLVKPGVVCEGYSEGFKLICDYLGIPCVLVFGNYDASANVAHMWNYIKMDDNKWYAVDLTWDDLDGDGGEVKYAYFLKGSRSFFTNHTEEPDYLGTIFTYPEIASDNYTPGQSVAATTTTTTVTTTTAKTTTTEAESTTTAKETTTTTETSTTTEKVTTTTTLSEPETTEPITTTSESETTTEAPSEPETETTTVTEYDKADFNRDGYVNAADLVICAKAVQGDVTDYPCDYNGDGMLDSFDLVLMRRRVLS